MNCRRCGRPLSSPESIAAGIGHTCSEKYRPTPDHPELFDEVERQREPVVKKSLTTDVIDFDKLRGLTT